MKELDFKWFIEKLKERNPKIIHPHCKGGITEFMASLKGENKTPAKNGLKRLQYFLNAYFQEDAVIKANIDKISYNGEGHFALEFGGAGTNPADLILTANNGNKYTIEVKLYMSEGSRQAAFSKTNFHKADYCFLYIISEHAWYVLKKVDNYNKKYTVDEIKETDPWLSDVRFPSFEYIKFQVNDDMSDSEVPNAVKYAFGINKGNKVYK